MKEARLYGPVKEFWTARGYTVRGEVAGCDLVARRDEELVVVELKNSMNLTLILQGIDRKAITEEVYLAVPAPKNPRRSQWVKTVRLCRMLGLGLLMIRIGPRGARVEVACEPGPYKPRSNPRRRRLLLEEFTRRSGDFNVGGSTGRPLVTAYREEALRIADYLHRSGPSTVKQIREAASSPKAGPILQRNYYGWFVRIARGVYDLTPVGQKAVEQYRDVIAAASPQL